MNSRMLLVAGLLLIGSGLLMAQSHELAVTAGGNFASGNSDFDKRTSFAYGGYYAGRIIHVPLAALYMELPVVAATNNGLREGFVSVGGGGGSSTFRYSSLFVTPGLKLKIAPEFPISPYIATGVGFARYHNTTQTSSLGTVGSDSSIKAVWDIGGGIDWKIAPFVSARAEVRDFRTGSPDLLSLKGGGSQHNVIPQVGLVFRF